MQFDTLEIAPFLMKKKTYNKHIDESDTVRHTVQSIVVRCSLDIKVILSNFRLFANSTTHFYEEKRKIEEGIKISHSVSKSLAKSQR